MDRSQWLFEEILKGLQYAYANPYVDFIFQELYSIQIYMGYTSSVMEDETKDNWGSTGNPTDCLIDYIVYSNVTLLKWEMKILYI